MYADDFLCVFATFQKYVGEVFKIISQQSTAKPGCIIELDAITDFVSIHGVQENRIVFSH